MASLIERLKETIHLHSERHKNRPFLEATMAAAALVAAADGAVSFSERVRIDQLLEHLDQLKVFDPHEAVNIFNAYVDGLRDSPEDGRAKALSAVAGVSDDREAATLMVRIATAISRADGIFTETERNELGAICAALDLSPEECEI